MEEEEKEPCLSIVTAKSYLNSLPPLTLTEELLLPRTLTETPERLGPGELYPTPPPPSPCLTTPGDAMRRVIAQGMCNTGVSMEVAVWEG